MKKNNKALLTFVCAILLVVATVCGTLAYFTAQDSVVNTFTVGNVAIKLDEAKVNEDGSYVTNHDERVKENKYHLLPGHTYSKDPTVTVIGGSEDVYVRMIVTLTKSAEWDAICAKYNVGAADMFVGLSEDWILQGHPQEDATKNTRTYEFWYKAKVAKNANDTVLDDLFTDIKMPTQLTNDDLASLGTEFKIDVVAHAIQADGFENAAEAWEEFATQHP